MAELDDLQDEVFRGIGRNVLNLQKMEGMLKFIVSSTGKLGSTQDPAQSLEELERSMKSRKKAIDRLPLGRLVGDLPKTLQPNETDQEKTVDSENGYCIEISIRVGDKNFTNELSQALREIVKERNELIHKRLIHFDLRSVKSCRELLRELDQQRARIKPQFERLSSICTSLRDHFKELKEYIDSESFVDDLKRAKEEHSGGINDSDGADRS